MPRKKHCNHCLREQLNFTALQSAFSGPLRRRTLKQVSNPTLSFVQSSMLLLQRGPKPDISWDAKRIYARLSKKSCLTGCSTSSLFVVSVSRKKRKYKYEIL